MKKLIAVVLLGAAALSGLYAQSGTGDMISASFVKEYNNYFVDSRGSIKGKYLRSFSDEEIGKYSALGGSNLDIDTAEEIAFLSYASGVVDIRPPEAAAMLPKNRESDLKIGALMYQNLQTAAFLRTANAAAYATLFNQFCAENNISKAEVKTYFDRNIAA
ncbi:MAG: hypothetical protein LBQ46_08270, partial [Treponema sp.]|nr:hypothetical protein [Treponema sp.]